MIELLMTLLVAALLLTIGVPSLQTFIKNGRLVTVTNELVSAFHVARSGAIKNGTFSCVCPSNNVSAAVPACNAGTNWEMGWIAFTDTTGNCVNPSNGVLLKVWDGSELDAGQIAVRTTDVSITATNLVRFNSRGATEGLNGSSQQGVFSICDDRGVTVNALGKSLATGVQVSVTGRVRSTHLASQINACPM